MGEREGHNSWSRIRPNWVRKMAEEPKEVKDLEGKDGPPGPGEKPEEVEGEKKGEATGVAPGAGEKQREVKPKEPAVKKVLQLADVEKELEEERKKTERLQKMLEARNAQASTGVSEQQRTMAELAARMSLEQDRQSQLQREVQLRLGVPSMPAGPPMRWVGASPSMFPPGMVVNYAMPGAPMYGQLPPGMVGPHGGVPHGGVPGLGSAQGLGSVPGCNVAQGCHFAQGCQAGAGGQAAPGGGSVAPLTPMVTLPTLGSVGPKAPPPKVLVKAIPTVGSSAASGKAGEKKDTPQGGVTLEPRKKTPEKPIQAKERPVVKEPAKNQPAVKPQQVEKARLVFPVDGDEPYDEEQEREKYLKERVKHPRVSDGLSEKQREERLRNADKGTRRMASMTTEGWKEERYMPCQSRETHLLLQLKFPIKGKDQW